MDESGDLDFRRDVVAQKVRYLTERFLDLREIPGFVGVDLAGAVADPPYALISVEDLEAAKSHPFFGRIPGEFDGIKIVWTSINPILITETDLGRHLTETVGGIN